MIRPAKTSLFVMTCLWLIFLATFNFNQNSHAQSKPKGHLTIAYAALNIQTAPLWLAQDEKLFAAEGLEVKMIYIPGGSPAVQSLVSGDLDLAYTSGGALVSAVLAGYPLKIIAGAVNYYPNAFFSSPDIRFPKDLKGKKVAVSRVGASSYFITVALLEKLGLKEGEYTIVQLGSTQARIAALIAGQIQGTTLPAPESLIAKEAGMRLLVPIQEIRRLGITTFHMGIAGSTDTLGKKSREVQGFLRAFAQGVALLYTQKEKAIQNLKRHTGIKEMKVLEETYGDHIVIDRFLIPKDEALLATLGLLSGTNPKALSARPRDFVDLTFIKRLEEEGLFDRLWRLGR